MNNFLDFSPGIFALEISNSGQKWLNNLQNKMSHIRQISEGLLRLISQANSEFLISLRIFYDPHLSQQRTFLCLRLDSAFIKDQSEKNEEIISILHKGILGDFYRVERVVSPIPLFDLNWVSHVGEIYKYEEFDQGKNWYRPYMIEPAPMRDTQAVHDIMRRVDHRILLEISFQLQHQTSFLTDAISQILTQLEAVKRSSGQDASLDRTLNLYQDYQHLYSHGCLFRFNIRVLTEKSSDALLILQALVDQATQPTHHGQQCPILLTAKGEPRFQKVLHATQAGEILPPPAWQGWQQELGQKYIKDAIAAKKSFRDMFDDGSMNLHQASSKPSLSEHASNPHASNLQHGGASVFSKLAPTIQSARLIDLRLLSYLATTQEISGFLCLPIPTETELRATQQATNQLPEVSQLGDLIHQHSHLITEDTYIVGLDQNGYPCVSDWDIVPHRLIAGVTGAGKTNFIKSVIYQSLYANSQRQIWVADFQAGMHYQLIADLHPGLQMVVDLKDFARLLNELWEEHERRRELMRTHRVTSLPRLKGKTGLDISRRILIIDEAAFILSAERSVRNEIDKHLINIAAMGRATGIHLIYCSQRPTPEVIPRLISDNMDERVIFRVQPTASVMLLDDDRAASLPIQPKGRAIYKGVDGLKLVVTPYVTDKSWEIEL